MKKIVTILILVNSIMYASVIMNSQTSSSSEIQPFILMTILTILFASIFLASIEANNTLYKKAVEIYNSKEEEMNKFIKKNSIEISVCAEAVRLNDELDSINKEIENLKEGVKNELR